MLGGLVRRGFQSQLPGIRGHASLIAPQARAAPLTLPFRSWRGIRALSSYVPEDVEQKWRETIVLPTPDTSSPPTEKESSYILPMFPYPSGRLHMGHVRVYTISDCLARYNHLNKKAVLHPIGWDAFGLPAENAARERGLNPQVWTKENISDMKNQFKQLGASFSWDKEVATCFPDYYKWTQWLFLKLHEAGHAYQKESSVNWDPVDQTVLANEQVDINGRSWRSGAIVEKKKMVQWFFRVSSFAKELNDDLDTLDGWPDNVKKMQKNWIGESEGALVRFKVEKVDDSPEGAVEEVEVFTTKLETLFGVTFLGVSATSPLLEQLVPKSKAEEVLSYAAHIEAEAPISQKEILKNNPDNNKPHGMYTGANVIHPVSGESIPVYVVDYVYSDYGTGVVMGVPGHDERDRGFAEEYGVEVRDVLEEVEGEDTKLINSGEYNGKTVQETRDLLIQTLQPEGVVEPTLTFKLRDWLISRQRYWGTPIPMLHCDNCGAVPVKEEDLPVVLPSAEAFTGEGNILEKMDEWANSGICSKCGGPARRETDTMDTFVDSSWYFLRYPDAHETDKPFTFQRKEFEVPDIYIGGVEHSILHLLYARFIMKFLKSQNLTTRSEPFPNLITQGLVLGQTYRDKATGKPIPSAEGKAIPPSEVDVTWEKMSKSKHNGVDPAEIFAKYGADTARVYALFKAPPDLDLQWDEEQILGPYRWLFRLWGLVKGGEEGWKFEGLEVGEYGGDVGEEEMNFLCEVKGAIEGVTAAMEGKPPLINTGVAELMKLSNTISRSMEQTKPSLYHYLALRSLIIMLSPLAPHISAELWSALVSSSSSSSSSPSSSSLSPLGEVGCSWAGGKTTPEFVFDAAWPEVDGLLEKAEESQLVTIVFSINGKKNSTVAVPKSVAEDQEALQELALDKTGKTREEVIRFVVPPGKGMVNLVMNKKKKK